MNRHIQLLLALTAAVGCLPSCAGDDGPGFAPPPVIVRGFQVHNNVGSAGILRVNIRPAGSQDAFFVVDLPIPAPLEPDKGYETFPEFFVQSFNDDGVHRFEIQVEFADGHVATTTLDPVLGAGGVHLDYYDPAEFRTAEVHRHMSPTIRVDLTP